MGEPPACLRLCHDRLQLRAQVRQCRELQQQRQQKLNATLASAEILQHKALTPPAKKSLKQAINKWGLSMRAQERVLRLALTLADLSAEEDITQAVLAEALSYRAYEQLQRKLASWL